jgi:heptosyltransferase III
MATIVYHIGALGDFLAVLPAVKLWRLVHPLDKTILLGKPAFGELGKLSGYFDDVWDAQRAAWSWLFSTAPVPEQGRQKFAGIAAAILFTATDAPIVGRMSELGVRDVYVQPPFPLERIPIYAYHLSLFQRHVYLLDDFGPSISVPASYATIARDILGAGKNPVALHPGSGSAKKNWPLCRFFSLAERIKKRGFSPLWLRGPAEEGLPAPDGCVVLDNAELPMLVRLFQSCRGYIGNDSGISHLAAAAGCPSIVLFGPSDPLVWKPYGAKVRALLARPGCAPCHPNNNGKPCPVGGCMERLSVDEVWEAFERLVTVSELSRRAARVDNS